MAEEASTLPPEPRSLLTDSAVRAADVVITMGCGDECPYYAGTRYLDWALDDPAGQVSTWSALSAMRSAPASTPSSPNSRPAEPDHAAAIDVRICR
jgi:hypothetical protein